MKFQIKALVLGIFASTATLAAEISTIQSLKELTVDVQSRYQPGEVIFVTDLDNTLLEFDRDIGSEHWFLWQKQLMDNNSSAAVAKSFPQLLSIQGLIMSLSTSRLVHSEQSSLYNGVVEAGSYVIGLTSRGRDTRDITIRELKRNNMKMIISPPKVAFVSQLSSQEASGLIFDKSRPEQSGLTTDVLNSQGVTDSREIAWSGGVLFTEGQNKGVMLASFLARMQDGQKIKAIVFLDDRSHHVKAVQEVVSELRPEIELHSIHLTISRPKVEIFEQSDKANAKIDFCNFLPGLRSLWHDQSTFPLNPGFSECGK